MTHVARRQVEITNALGLHLRPADKFVRLAHQFESEVRVYYNGNEFNGKSILDLTTLAAECGTRLDVEARGPDAEAAVAALADLVSARFYETDDGQDKDRAHEPSGRQANGPPGRPAAGRRPPSGPRGPLTPPAPSPGTPPCGASRSPRPCRPCGASPSAPAWRSARPWSSTPAACACRPAPSPPRPSPAELDRLDAGLDGARAEAEAAEADARKRLGPQYADILAAHGRMISDPELRRDARDRDRARQGRRRARRLRGPGRLRRPPGRARRQPPRRPRRRRPRHPAADPRPPLRRPARPRRWTPRSAPSVALAHDLSPSETAGLDPGVILGFATEAGGRTSHTAIVAAALEIPAVVGLGGSSTWPGTAAPSSSTATRGWSSSTPTARPWAATAGPRPRRAARFAGLAGLAHLPAETLDGVRVGLLGNIEFPAEVAACLEPGRRRRRPLPDRVPVPQRRAAAHRGRAVRRLRGRGPLPGGPARDDPDPRPRGRQARLLPGARAPRGRAQPVPRACGASGSRCATRRSFRTQLRAILRASALGDVRVMFPLVSTLGEFRQARAILDDVAAELAAEGVAVRADLPVGVMIEVPAAAVDGRPTGQGGGFLLDRDQRPDPVHPGRRPDQRDRRRPLQRRRPGRPPPDRHGRRGGRRPRASRSPSAGRWGATRCTPCSCWAWACAA